MFFCLFRKVQEMKMKGARQMDVDKVENTHVRSYAVLSNSSVLDPPTHPHLILRVYLGSCNAQTSPQACVAH